MYKFKAEDEDVKVEDLKVNIANDATVFTTSTDASNAIATVKLYDGATLVASQAVSAGVATFDNIGWVVPASTTKTLTVKVDVNNIGTSASDTAKSGMAFTTTLTVDEVKGNESGDVFTAVETTPTAAQVQLANAADELAPATTNYFGIANNKVLVALLSDKNTIGLSPSSELLKIKLYDNSTDSDNARIGKLSFKVSATGTAAATGTFTLTGGNVTWTCASTATTVVCTTPTNGDFATAMEVSSTGTTLVLKADYAVAAASNNASVTTSLVVNSNAPGGCTTGNATDCTADGVVWFDGGDDSATYQAAPVSINWIDLGEAGKASGIYDLSTTVSK
jgi:hypothetical protein